eukprot:sb/3473121/
MAPFLDLTPSDYDTVLNTNLKGAYFVAQAVARNMVQHGRKGSIVNVSSQASQAALSGHTLYGMSKAGLDNLTKNMALELGQHGIRVNSINPTVVMTDLAREHWGKPENGGPMLARIPLGRFAELQDVVGPVLFLLSDQSSMVNASCLPIEGGFLAT